MNNKEIRKSMKKVYGALWDVLALYEVTDGYNEVPKGEKAEDIWDYTGTKLLEIRKMVSVQFLGEPHIVEKLM